MLTYERYSELRDAKSLTDYKMSLLTGIPKSTFSAWRHGNGAPKIETLCKIAKVLELPPRELVSKKDIKQVKLKGE